MHRSVAVLSNYKAHIKQTLYFATESLPLISGLKQNFSAISARIERYVLGLYRYTIQCVNAQS